MIAFTRCARVRRRLGAFLDGELPAEEARRFEAHLDDCARCREALLALRHDDTRVRDAGVESPPDEYWDAFLPRLRARMAEATEGEGAGAGAHGAASRAARPAADRRRTISPLWSGVIGGVAIATLALLLYVSHNNSFAPVSLPAPPPAANAPTPATAAPAANAPPVNAPAPERTPVGAVSKSAPAPSASTRSRSLGHVEAGPRSTPAPVTAPRGVGTLQSRSFALDVARGAAGGPAQGAALAESAASAETTAAAPLPPDVIARDVLARIATIESDARRAGKAPDYTNVVPVLESLEPAARDPKASGMSDSLAAEVFAALARARR